MLFCRGATKWKTKSKLDTQEPISIFLLNELSILFWYETRESNGYRLKYVNKVRSQVMLQLFTWSLFQPYCLICELCGFMKGKIKHARSSVIDVFQFLIQISLSLDMTISIEFAYLQSWFIPRINSSYPKRIKNFLNRLIGHMVNVIEAKEYNLFRRLIAFTGGHLLIDHIQFHFFQLIFVLLYSQPATLQ